MTVSSLTVTSSKRDFGGSAATGVSTTGVVAGAGTGTGSTTVAAVDVVGGGTDVAAMSGVAGTFESRSCGLTDDGLPDVESAGWNALAAGCEGAGGAPRTRDGAGSAVRAVGEAGTEAWSPGVVVWLARYARYVPVPTDKAEMATTATIRLDLLTITLSYSASPMPYGPLYNVRDPAKSRQKPEDTSPLSGTLNP